MEDDYDTCRESSAAALCRGGYFLVGPTASGKTDVAQWIAERHGAEILSADSMLVYGGMDIGTAKPDAAARRRVRYHGVDLTTPDRSFNVGQYLACIRLSLLDTAPTAVAEPLPPGGWPARGGGAAGALRRPILLAVGGTGLYVKGLIQGLVAAPPANPGVRAYWTDVLEEDGIEALQEGLRQRSPGLYEALRDKRNARRLIRALELAETGLQALPRTWEAAREIAPLAGLRPRPELRNARIERRVRAMYAHGFLEEVQLLRTRWPALSDTARQAIGYAEAMAHLEGRCSLDEAVAQTITRTRQLAKRQGTWFAHQANVRWIDVEDGVPVQAIAERVMKHWSEYGPTDMRF